MIEPGPQHWAIFRALAIERRATWVSLDRGFARFRELSWVNPADSH